MNITTLTDPILEKTTPKLTAVLQDENGNPIAGSALGTLTLTLYNLNDGPTYTILNSRDNQNVLNTNNVTVDESGNLTWEMQTGDTPLVDAALDIEKHRAVFTWTYNGGTKTGRHVIDMAVKNLQKVV